MYEVQPIEDRVAQHFKIISKNFRFSARRTRILVGLITYHLVLVVNPMCRILARWKRLRNNLEILCHPICNWLYKKSTSRGTCVPLVTHTHDMHKDTSSSLPLLRSHTRRLLCPLWRALSYFLSFPLSLSCSLSRAHCCSRPLAFARARVLSFTRALVHALSNTPWQTHVKLRQRICYRDPQGS